MGDIHGCVRPTYFTRSFMNSCIKMVMPQFYCAGLLYDPPLSRFPAVSLHFIPFPSPLLLSAHSPSFGSD